MRVKFLLLYNKIWQITLLLHLVDNIFVPNYERIMNALFCLICSYFEGDLSGAKLKDDWYYTSFILILVCFAIDFAICALSIVGFFTAFSWRPYITEVRSLFACSAMTMLTHSPKSSTRGKWPRPHSRAHLSFGLKLSEPNRFWEEAFH